MEQNGQAKKHTPLQSAWFIFKRNVILVLVIVFLITGIGVFYAYNKKPNYTASAKVRYMVTVTDIQGTYEDVTSMMAFVDTVVDFVDEGVVLDRASYYYKKWLDAKAEGNELDKFLLECESLAYDANISIVDNKYKYHKDNINIITSTVDNQTQLM